MRLRGDVYGTGVVEHRGLERQRGEITDRADDPLGAAGVGRDVDLLGRHVRRVLAAPGRVEARGLEPALGEDADPEVGAASV